VFTVRLPAVRADDMAALAAPARPAGARRGRRVLVVDDNEDFASLLADLLAADGHEALTVHDGPAALRAVEAFRPEVAVLDVGLPVMDGYELAQQLAARLGPAAPAFLGVSGYGQAPDLARGRAAGFRRHLVKPADPITVLRLVEELARERDGRIAPEVRAPGLSG
jgi:CheY-like chemotaxis protein